MRREKCDLKILKETTLKRDKQSVVKRNLFNGKEEIVLIASIIAVCNLLNL